MDGIIVILIALFLLAGGVYLILSRRANAQASRQAVLNTHSRASAASAPPARTPAVPVAANAVQATNHHGQDAVAAFEDEPAPTTQPKRATAPLTLAQIEPAENAAQPVMEHVAQLETEPRNDVLSPLSSTSVPAPMSINGTKADGDAQSDPYSESTGETPSHSPDSHPAPEATVNSEQQNAPEADGVKRRTSTSEYPTLHTHNMRFRIHFANGNVAEAVRVRPSTEPNGVLALLNMSESAPTIFITGGASAMSEEDILRTQEMIAAVAEFAEQHRAVIVDGGTESGVMQMVGEARRQGSYLFPLIGVSPFGKISYPGMENPNAEAELEDSHSHFVLVDGEEWGAESDMIVGVAKALSGQGMRPAIGILINGGKIARQEVYLAVSKEIPMLILEGSGRLADEIATAFKTGKASQRILQAILGGGDIQLISTDEGTGALREKLEKRFKR